MDDIVYVSINSVTARNHPYMMKIMQTNFLVIFLEGGTLLYFSHFWVLSIFENPQK